MICPMRRSWARGPRRASPAADDPPHAAAGVHTTRADVYATFRPVLPGGTIGSDNQRSPAAIEGSPDRGAQGRQPMPIASSYPFLNILWTMLIFFAWVVWIWMMIVILT